MIVDTTDLASVSETDWPDLVGLIRDEGVRRDAIRNTETQIYGLINRYQIAAGINQVSGAEWVQPTSFLDAYKKDAEVSHNGKTWVSLRDGASGEPGLVPGDWQEKQIEGQYTEWVQPMAGSEYPIGALVTHNGHKWRNDYTNVNPWEPGATGAQWTDLGPVA